MAMEYGGAGDSSGGPDDPAAAMDMTAMADAYAASGLGGAGANPPNDEQFAGAQLNRMIEQNHPILGNGFWPGQCVIAQFFHPPQDGLMRGALERNLQDLLKNAATLSNRPKTCRRPKFERD